MCVRVRVRVCVCMRVCVCVCLSACMSVRACLRVLDCVHVRACDPGMRMFEVQPEWLQGGRLRDYQLMGLNFLVQR